MFLKENLTSSIFKRKEKKTGKCTFIEYTTGGCLVSFYNKILSLEFSIEKNKHWQNAHLLNTPLKRKKNCQFKIEEMYNLKFLATSKFHKLPFKVNVY